MEKRDFTVKELVKNASFRRMLNGTANAVEIDYWSRWIEANDENRDKTKKAIAKLVGFELIDYQWNTECNLESEWSRLYKSTVGKQVPKRHSIYGSERTFQWIYRIAAILLIGSMVDLGFWLYSQSIFTTSQSNKNISWKTIKTPKNQRKTLIFSNGAKIVLNNNSFMTY